MLQIIEKDVAGGVFELKGKLQADGGDTLLKQTVIELVRSGYQHMILDLQQVPSADAAGLGALVSVRSTVECNGGTLELHNLSPRLRELLTITKLDSVFTIRDCEAPTRGSVSAAGSTGCIGVGTRAFHLSCHEVAGCW